MIKTLPYSNTLQSHLFRHCRFSKESHISGFHVNVKPTTINQFVLKQSLRCQRNQARLIMSEYISHENKKRTLYITYLASRIKDSMTCRVEHCLLTVQKLGVFKTPLYQSESMWTVRTTLNQDNL